MSHKTIDPGWSSSGWSAGAEPPSGNSASISAITARTLQRNGHQPRSWLPMRQLWFRQSLWNTWPHANICTASGSESWGASSCWQMAQMFCPSMIGVGRAAAAPGAPASPTASCTNSANTCGYNPSRLGKQENCCTKSYHPNPLKKKYKR